MNQLYISKKESRTASEAASLGMVFGGFLLLLVALLWPLASIWALNTLFGFGIKFTFWNWLAAWVLILTFQGAINVSRKRD